MLSQICLGRIALQDVTTRFGATLLTRSFLETYCRIPTVFSTLP